MYTYVRNKRDYSGRAANGSHKPHFCPMYSSNIKICERLKEKSVRDPTICLFSQRRFQHFEIIILYIHLQPPFELTKSSSTDRFASRDTLIIERDERPTTNAPGRARERHFTDTRAKKAQRRDEGWEGGREGGRAEGREATNLRRPDALRVEWRQNGSDDTDVMSRARAHLTMFTRASKSQRRRGKSDGRERDHYY